MRKREISRKSFLKGSVAGIAGIAGLGLLGTAYGAQGEAKLEEGQFAFEIPPAPIPEEEIIETIQADVVVVGAGIGGSVAALAAAAEGASVIVLQKGPSPMTHGINYAAFNSKKQLEAGIQYDLDAVSDFLTKEAYGYGDQDLIRNVVYSSGPATDMICEFLEGRGLGEMLLTSVPPQGDDTGYVAMHTWQDVDYLNPYSRVPLLNNRLCDAAAERFGVEFRFNCPGEQLEKDGDGRVTACIAKSEAGYIRAKASRGVILATGDIMNDPQMVRKYAPFNVGVPCTYYPPYNTGDGHKMGLWIGGLMNRGPFAQAIHHDPSSLPEGDAPFSGSPYLAVNKLGLRYQNEDYPYPIICNANTRQPDMIRWHIIDAHFPEYWNDLGSDQMCRNAGFMFNSNEEALETCLANGAILRADTLEELADRMGFSGSVKETFLATCARYQELVELGEDLDYGKNPEYLVKTPVKDPPFYAIKRRPGNLALLDGFVVTKDLQIVDENRSPIPGLYGCGNTTGCFFNVDYTLNVPGISIGRAIATGYIAGKSAAGA